MRVIVTGSAGFIGRRVVRALRADGWDVGEVDIRAAPGLDVRDVAALERVFAGADVVVHLAAKVGLGVDLGDMTDYVDSNGVGTAAVLQAAGRSGVARVVFASSMTVYGEGAYRCPMCGPAAAPPRQRSDLEAGRFDPTCPTCRSPLIPELVTESAPADPRNTYAATKLLGEHLVASWARETGGRATSLRFHNVYGPGMPKDTPYAGVAAIFRSAIRRGLPPTVLEDGRQRRDFVHVDDVAAAVAAAAAACDQTPASHRAFNIGSGRVHTIGQLAALLAEAADGPVPVVTGGYRLGDVRHVTASSAAAMAELGWMPRIELRAGLATLGDRRV